MKWVEIKPQNFVFLAKHPCRSKMKIATSHKGGILIDVWNAGFLQWRHCREATEATLICARCVFAAVITYSWFLLFICYYISRFIFFWRVLLCFFIDKSFCHSPEKLKLAKALDPSILKFLHISWSFRWLFVWIELDFSPWIGLACRSQKLCHRVSPS